MNRRAFLSHVAAAAGGALVSGAAVGGVGGYELHEESNLAGAAVGLHRPDDVRATTITYRGPSSSPNVALTFDDGPSTRYTERVLDILDDKDVAATFFVIGEHAERLPDLVRRTAQRHDVGNHTWDHPNLSDTLATDAQRQLTRTSTTITSLTGRAPAAFRPPYGSFSGATAMVAAGLGYPIVLWDFEFDQHRETAAENLTRMTALARPGSIILGHDGGTLDCDVVVQVLPELIDAIRAKGLHPVTLTELLGTHPASHPQGALRTSA